MMLSLWLLLAVIVVGCGPVQADQSVWGTITTIATAQQGTAPAFWPENGSITAAWIAADERGVHQDAQTFASELTQDTVVLPLPPVHPYAQQLLPAQNGNWHLLWLDASPDTGEIHLYSALLSPDLTVLRGPTAISEQLTLRYAVISGAGGGVTVVWSGGLLSEPTLYLQHIDARGLPGTPTPITYNGDWPTVTHSSDGITHLFWLQEGNLHYGQIQGNNLEHVTRIAQGPQPRFGDRLHNLSAAVDSTHLYLFWNITRSGSADAESWVLAAQQAAPTWTPPARVSVATGDDTLETGFNSGTVKTAQRGDTITLRWASPAAGEYDTLPVAVAADDSVGIVYYQSGDVAGYQQIASTTRLIGLPAIRIDRDRHIYLAWAEPLDSGAAALNLTATRR